MRRRDKDFVCARDGSCLFFSLLSIYIYIRRAEWRVLCEHGNGVRLIVRCVMRSMG